MTWSLELVANPDGSEALLYIYRDGEHVRTATGRAKTLREFAAREYVGAAFHETVVHGWFEQRDVASGFGKAVAA